MKILIEELSDEEFKVTVINVLTEKENVKLNSIILRFFNVCSSMKVKNKIVGEYHTPETHLIPTVVYKNLTNQKVSKEQLIEFSFKFLLEREPNTSILSSFELSSISTYFPQFIKIAKEWSTNN